MADANAPLANVQQTLRFEAQPSARQKLGYLFWVRFSSAGALIFPSIAATAFMWNRTRVAYEQLPDGSAVPDTLTQGANYLFWTVWIPISLVSLAAGAVCAWLAWRALAALRRTITLTPNGVESMSVTGSLHLPWSAVRALDVGESLDFRYELGTITLREDWVGRERLDKALEYAKTRLPKERIHQAPTSAEELLLRALKVLPTVFLGLVAALACALLYWIFLRR